MMISIMNRDDLCIYRTLFLRLIHVLNNIKGISWYIIDLLLLKSSDNSIIKKQAINLIKESTRI